MNERPFNCCNCTLNFKRRHHLERHLNTHSEITRSQALKYIANFNSVKDVMNVIFKPIKKVSFGPLPEKKVIIKPLPEKKLSMKALPEKNVKSNIKIRIKCLQQNYAISDRQYNPAYFISVKEYKPLNQTPIYQTPIYQTPVYQPPVYQPPIYQSPVYQPPVYQKLSDLLLGDDDEITYSFPEEEKECCKKIKDDLEYISHMTYDHKDDH